MQLYDLVLYYAFEIMIILVLYYAFKIMITMPFYLDLSGKNFCQEILRSKNFKQKLRHQVVEAEAIQKLLLSHPWL